MVDVDANDTEGSVVELRSARMVAKCLLANIYIRNL